MPGPQNFRHRPGLRYAACSAERRVAVENLAQRAQPGRVDLPPQWLEKLPSGRSFAVHAIVRKGQGAKQPAPDRPLVVGRISLAWFSAVMCAVPGFTGCQAAQAVAGEQVTGAK